jgi:opacity protein-like surface antigen
MDQVNMPASAGLTFQRLSFVIAVQLPAWVGAVQAEDLVSAYTGSSFTRQSDLHIARGASGNDITFRDVDWSARPLDAAPYYGLRYTHFFSALPAWAVAVDYTHYKVYAKTGTTVQVQGLWNGLAVNGAAPLVDYVQQFEISHGVNMLSINGIYRWLDMTISSGRLQPYAGAGLTRYWMHSENMVDGVFHETGYQSSGHGFQVLAGASYKITPQVYAFAEAKFNRAKANVDIADGQAESRLRTLHASVGVSYAF